MPRQENSSFLFVNLPAGPSAIYTQIADANVGSDDGLRAMKKLTLVYVGEGRGPEARAAYEGLMAEYAGHEGFVFTQIFLGKSLQTLG